MSQTERKPVNHSSPNRPEPSSSEASSGTAAKQKRSTRNGVCSIATEIAASAAVDQKARDVKAIDVSKECSFADNFLIASGTSERHVKGIADKIARRLRDEGIAPLSISGGDRGEWIVLDYDDLIVHVFYEPSRQFYELDAIWSQSPEVPLNEKLQEEIRYLRTGSFV